MAAILIVEDDKMTNDVICDYLCDAGHMVYQAFDGTEALKRMEEEEVELVILDIMLPGLDGFQVLKRMRAAGKQTPVLFLSAKGDTEDIVEGLDSGADDYMVKPFVFKELLARIKVMTRRKPEIQENVYRCGDLVIDYNTHEVTRNNIPIALSPREFAVLLYLVRNKNIIVTREQIESNIWKLQSDVSSNLVDVYIRYLRRKIDDDFEEKMICTIRGTGYMLKCEE